MGFRVWFRGMLCARLLPVLLCALLLTNRANAQASLDAVAKTIARGGIETAFRAATVTHVTGNMPGRELRDWVDPGTGMSGGLFRSCGLPIQLRLSGTSTQNFLNVSIANSSRQTVTLDARGVFASFDSAPRGSLQWALAVRHLQARTAQSVSIPPGYWSQRAFAFPKKSDFATSDRIGIELRLLFDGQRACLIDAVLERPRSIERDARSSISYTNVDLEFGGGLRLAGTGGAQELDTDKRWLLGASLRWFPTFHHGLSLQFIQDIYGSLPTTLVAKNLAPDDALAKGQAVSNSLLAGYDFRIHLRPWLAASYGLSLGAATFTFDRPDIDSTVFMAHQELRLRCLVEPSSAGYEFAIAATLAHSYIPVGKLGTLDLAGNRFSAGLAMVIGW